MLCKWDHFRKHLTNKQQYFITDEIIELPTQVPVIKPDLDRANPKIGISAMAFSADNRYLATKNGEIVSLI